MIHHHITYRDYAAYRRHEVPSGQHSIDLILRIKVMAAQTSLTVALEVRTMIKLVRLDRYLTVDAELVLQH